MALEGLGQQQNSFYAHLGEMKMRFQMQEEAFRKAKLQGWMEYMQKQEAIRHAEAEAKRRRYQSLGLQAAAIGTAAVAGPITGAIGGAATMKGPNQDLQVAQGMGSYGEYGMGPFGMLPNGRGGY